MTPTYNADEAASGLVITEGLPAPDARGKIDPADVVRWATSVYTPAVDQNGNTVLLDEKSRRAVPLADASKTLSAALWDAADVVLSDETFKAAMRTVRSFADRNRCETALRVARRGARVWLDLGDTIVSVQPDGWSLESTPDPARPYFLPAPGGRTIPRPSRNGSRADLAKVLGLPPDSTQFRACWGWLVGAAALPDAPRPILWVTGAPGSAKTLRTLMVTSVIAPAESLGAFPDALSKDLDVAASQEYLLTFDDVPMNAVGEKVSKWLTRLVTGTTIKYRVLYSDNAVNTLHLKRAAAVTSIDLPAGIAADNIERTSLVHFSKVQGRTEAEVRAEFETLHPAILGALLDDVAATLAADIPRPGSLHRLGDFHLSMLALEQMTGQPYASEFITGGEDAQTAMAMEEPIVLAVFEFMAERTGRTWVGTNDELLSELSRVRIQHGIGSGDSRWPQTSTSLSRALNMRENVLRLLGIDTTRSALRHMPGTARKAQRLRSITMVQESEVPNAA